MNGNKRRRDRHRLVRWVLSPAGALGMGLPCKESTGMEHGVDDNAAGGAILGGAGERDAVSVVPVSVASVSVMTGSVVLVDMVIGRGGSSTVPSPCKSCRRTRCSLGNPCRAARQHVSVAGAGRQRVAMRAVVRTV